MYDNKKSPRRKMSKARTGLLLNDPFFGSLAMRLKMRPMEEWEAAQEKNINGFATAWTDGVELVYSEEFVKDLSLAECKGLIAHEVFHVAMKHVLRRGNRDPMKWNLACDYATNPILHKANYEVPDPMINSAYEGKSAERIYGMLPDGKSGGGSQIPDQGQSQGQGQSQSQGQGQSQIQLPPKSTIIKDAPINLHDKKQVQKFEEKLDMEIQQAAKNAGTLPGIIERIIKKQKEHTVDEWDILREFMEKSTIKEDYSWMRPNRRFSEADFLMPGFDEDYDQPSIIVGVDVSGSITNSELAVYATKISNVLEEFHCSFKVIYFDTKIQNTQELDSDEMPIELKSRGGGGTKFKVFFDHLKQMDDLEAEAILFFTDMEAWDWGKFKDPGIPVLWMNTNRRKDNFNPPFGITVPIKV